MVAHIDIVKPAVADAAIATSMMQSNGDGEIERKSNGISRPSCDHAADSERRTATNRIEQARCAFVSRACTRIDRATELTALLKSNDPSTAKAALAELHTIAHGLSGTAGSFGYYRLSELAGMLEEIIIVGQCQYRKIIVLVMEIAVEFINYIVDRRSDFAR